VINETKRPKNDTTRQLAIDGLRNCSQSDTTVLTARMAAKIAIAIETERKAGKNDDNLTLIMA